LDRDGVFLSFARSIAATALGFPIEAFINVQLRQVDIPRITEELADIPEAVQAHGLSGQVDLLVRVASRDARHLFDTDARLLAIDGVERTETHLVMREVIPYRLRPLLDLAATTAQSSPQPRPPTAPASRRHPSAPARRPPGSAPRPRTGPATASRTAGARRTRARTAPRTAPRRMPRASRCGARPSLRRRTRAWWPHTPPTAWRRGPAPRVRRAAPARRARRRAGCRRGSALRSGRSPPGARRRRARAAAGRRRRARRRGSTLPRTPLRPGRAPCRAGRIGRR